MGQTVRFQEILRRMAMIDEGFVEDQARLGLDPAQASALDPKTAALLHVAVCELMQHIQVTDSAIGSRQGRASVHTS
jgi:hypothetical protein